MKKWPMGLVVAVMLVAAPPTDAQQGSHHVNVYVEHKGEDVVGRAFVCELREQFHASTRYRVAANRDPALFTVYVVSAARRDDEGKQSAIATTLTRDDHESFVHGAVQIVGPAAIHKAVRSLFETMDRKIEQSLRMSPERPRS